MKIIDTDNFGGDYPGEKDIAVGIKNPKHAYAMADALNKTFCGYATAPRCFRAVEDDYENQPGMEAFDPDYVPAPKEVVPVPAHTAAIKIFRNEEIKSIAAQLLAASLVYSRDHDIDDYDLIKEAYRMATLFYDHKS